MIISNSKNFLYIHLEKCGGTSIEYALKPYLDDKDIFISSLDFGDFDVEKYYMNNYNLWKHTPARQIKEYLNDKWDIFYKFATVRNPTEIMISLYYYNKDFFDKNNIYGFNDVEYNENLNNNFIIQNNKLITSSTHSLYFAQSILDNTHINGFIDKTIKNNDYSVSSQIDRLDPNVEIFDISQINDKWTYILKKIKMPTNIPLKQLNKSTRPDNVVLNLNSINLIYERFYNDYQIIPKLTKVKWI